VSLGQRDTALENRLDNRSRHAIESAVAAALCRRSPKSLTTPAVFSRSDVDFTAICVAGQNRWMICCRTGRIWTAVASAARHRFGKRIGQSNAPRHPKAPSPLRFAGAVQNHSPLRLSLVVPTTISTPFVLPAETAGSFDAPSRERGQLCPRVPSLNSSARTKLSALLECVMPVLHFVEPEHQDVVGRYLGVQGVLRSGEIFFRPQVADLVGRRVEIGLSF